MRIIYRKQLPGQAPRETSISGWVATAIAGLILVALLTLTVVLLPFFLVGVLVFIALIVFMLIAGWVYAGFRIGFRNLWDLTKLLFGVGFGSMPWSARRERLWKEWEDRAKGKPGVWTK